MGWSDQIDEPILVRGWAEERRILSDTIGDLGTSRQPLAILEAGCGLSWGLDLKGLESTITGVDVDQNALEQRLNVKKDLNRAICGDLRTVELDDDSYDVIYNSYVLEHIEGAKDVLLRFERWLRPGGIMLVIIPNRDSVWGFMTRVTPFWFHVKFKRYVLRDQKAGTPGYGPFRTYYDKVVSQRGIHDFCRERRLRIKAVYSVGHGRKIWKPSVRAARSIAVFIIHFASLGSLSRKHANLMFVIEKPAKGATPQGGC